MTKFDNLWHVTHVTDRDIAISLFVAIDVPGLSGVEYQQDVHQDWTVKGVTVLVNFIHNFKWTKEQYEDLCFTRVLTADVVAKYRHFFNGIQKFERLAKYNPADHD